MVRPSSVAPRRAWGPESAIEERATRQSSQPKPAAPLATEATPIAAAVITAISQSPKLLPPWRFGRRGMPVHGQELSHLLSE